MKKLILITALIQTMSLQAAEVCDLKINVPSTEGESSITIISKAELKEQPTGSDGSGVRYLHDLVGRMAILECEKQGATNCIVLDSRNRFDKHHKVFGDYELRWVFFATAQGTKIIPGRKLSDAEIGKKRLKLLCAKVDECINRAVNDPDSSNSYVEKLYTVKERNSCGQIENFIFNN